MTEADPLAAAVGAFCPGGCSVLGFGGVAVMTPTGPRWLAGHSSSCPALEIRDKGLRPKVVA